MEIRYHFIGIGGIGMSGIARLYRSRGFPVSGSDLKETEITRQLRSCGMEVFIGHRAQNLGAAQRVVYSAAIRDDNPEMQAARQKGIPLLRRAQALAELMAGKNVITVTGSHGKTTTSSLISYLLLEAGLNPTAAIGGIVRNIDSNACAGDGEFFVAEADESDGSFLYYRPRYSVITNIDREHLDYYGDFRREVELFREFISYTEEGGCVFACSDDANLKEIAAACGRRHVLFGLRDGAALCARNIRLQGLSSEFDCFYRGRPIARFCLALGGEHNVSNALAVIGIGLELGISPEVIKKALSGYRGAGRRLEVKLRREDGLTVIDDYAHHPAEIRATLAAAAHLAHRRVIAAFQPHRYTRTALLMDDFARSFDAVDCLVLSEVYPASEFPIAGASSAELLRRIKARLPQKQALLLPKEEIAGYLAGVIGPEDLVLILGAGDIAKVSDELVQMLKGPAA
jgi:UDP-N-acetylmuramate--alanine ligase